MKTLLRILLVLALAGLCLAQAPVRTMRFPAAASVSSPLSLTTETIVGLVLPAAWTQADLTLQVSHDGASYADFYDSEGVEYLIKAAANRYVLLKPQDFVGVKYIRLRSGTSAAPVPQQAERIIRVVVRGF